MPTLEFKGKTTIWNHHLSVPYHALEEIKSLDFAPHEGAGHVMVEGDNLLALKALLPKYGGKVKCIYIDPPYNTGNEGWVYNDKVNSPTIRSWLGKTVDKEDLTRHDKWLCMMVPRLQLLRELLAEEGVIFVSIDDNEVHNLRAIMDKIFGEENFVGDIIRKTKSMTNDAKTGFNIQHENCLIFAKHKENMQLNGEKKDFSKYKNPDNDSAGAWVTIDPSARTGEINFEIKNPYTGKVDTPPLGRCWGFSHESFQKYIKSGKIIFKKKHKGQ